MKQREQPIEIWFDQGQPTILQRQGWAEPIEEIVERWDVRGRWWVSDTQRHYMTVRTGRGTFDVYADRKTRRWAITTVYD
jgi:hypothetical protein